ncbi:unnamed protein product [Dibothriocephalus latus]|uniref:Uncharacterized protein n=1 Tax=Dibothriocephalus latus TaxID=60516 RepID=A0A3P7MS77_DIBLA|nr:unnamed protein product [Dibothriocephalus latus]
MKTTSTELLNSTSRMSVVSIERTFRTIEFTAVSTLSLPTVMGRSPTPLLMNATASHQKPYEFCSQGPSPHFVPRQCHPLALDRGRNAY